MYYTVYKTTNLVNGRIYIGCHKTKNTNDGYLGSGKALKYAIKKYGRHNFNKEILEVFDNAEDMFEMESKLVNEEFIKDRKNYNIVLGGDIDAINMGKMGNKKLKGLHENDPEFVKMCTEKTVKGLLKYFSEHEGHWTGRKHTRESKKKIGDANRIHQQGSNNSNYGSTGIFNFELKENKSILKDDLQKGLDVGGLKGRIFNGFKYEENLKKPVKEKMPIVVNRKRCNKCEIWKGTDKFNKKGKDGFQPICKKCNKKKCDEGYQKNKKHKKEYNRKHNLITK